MPSRTLRRCACVHGVGGGGRSTCLVNRGALLCPPPRPGAWAWEAGSLGDLGPLPHPHVHMVGTGVPPHHPVGLPDGCYPESGERGTRPRVEGECQGPAMTSCPVGAGDLSTLGGPLLAARDSICSCAKVSPEPGHHHRWPLMGHMESRWGFPPPCPFAGPQPKATFPLAWTLRGWGVTGTWSSRGPSPSHPEPSRAAHPPGLWGFLAPYGVSQGKTPPSKEDHQDLSSKTPSSFLPMGAPNPGA